MIRRLWWFTRASRGPAGWYLWSCRSGSGQKIETTKRGDPPANRRSGTNFVIDILIIPPRILARADEVRHVGFRQILLKVEL
jgi:hypothetical protein